MRDVLLPLRVILLVSKNTFYGYTFCHQRHSPLALLLLQVTLPEIVSTFEAEIISVFCNINCSTINVSTDFSISSLFRMYHIIHVSYMHSITHIIKYLKSFLNTLYRIYNVFFSFYHQSYDIDIIIIFTFYFINI